MSTKYIVFIVVDVIFIILAIGELVWNIVHPSSNELVFIGIWIMALAITLRGLFLDIKGKRARTPDDN
jgi:hypothetical protein